MPDSPSLDAASTDILIVSSAVDPATAEVSRILCHRGASHLVFNTEEFPFDSALTIEVGGVGDAWQFEKAGACNVITSPAAIWYRRVRAPQKPPDLDAGIYEFCLREARAAILGTVLASPCKRVMSSPPRVWAAEQKLLQLRVATRMGLKVPPTVVTNDPAAVIAAFQQFNQQMIVKPLKTAHVDQGDEQLAIFTSQVLQEHLADVESVRWAPSIYQPLIKKAADVRVTVVGREIFVAEIDSQGDPAAIVDWRRTVDPHLPHRRANLPEKISATLLQLLDELALSFAAIDLIRDQSNDYHFLEVNPSGQWLWLDDALELGISDAVANWLMGDVISA